MSIFDVALEYLVDMGMLWPDRYAPYYLASIGCHIANLSNRRYLDGGTIYHTEGGLVPDLRLNLLMVCPSGYGKSYTPKRFISEGSKTGFLDQSGINAVYRGFMTEAGLIGTFKDGQEIRGLAWTHRDGIICLNELDAIQGEGENSGKLDNAILDFLDDGWVHKTLSGGDINYQSFSTLWAGTQHSRFKLSSGQGRRWLLMEFIPSSIERQALKTTKRSARGLKPDFVKLGKVRAGFSKLLKGFAVRELSWSQDLYDYLDFIDPDLTHNDEELIGRLALGYNIVKYYKPGARNLDVKLDPTLEGLIDRSLLWRASIMGDSHGAQLLSMIKEHPDGIQMSHLKKKAQAFGLSYVETAEVLDSLKRHEAIIMSRIKTKGRPVTMVRANPEVM